MDIQNHLIETIEEDINQLNILDYSIEIDTVVDNVFDSMDDSDNKKANYYLSKEEIDKLLDEHLTKVEQLIRQYTTSVDTLTKSSSEKTRDLSKGLLDDLRKGIAEFKDNLQVSFITKKDHAVYNIQDKSDSLRIYIKNSINSRILQINESLRRLVEKIDQLIVLEDKKVKPMPELDEISAEANEMVNDEEDAAKYEDSEETESIEKKESSIVTPDKNIDDTVHQEEIYEDRTDEKIAKIEELSKTLKLPIKTQDKEAINNLSEKEKEELIKQLTSEVTKSEQKNSIEDVEIEVG